MAYIRKSSKQFTLRIPNDIHDLLIKRCDERGLTPTKYISELIQTDAKDLTHYFAQASARNSFVAMSLSMLMVNNLPIPDDQKKAIFDFGNDSAHEFYGPALPIPAEIEATFSDDKTDLLSELVEVFVRHSELRKRALNAKK